MAVGWRISVVVALWVAVPAMAPPAAAESIGRPGDCIYVTTVPPEDPPSQPNRTEPPQPPPPPPEPKPERYVKISVTYASCDDVVPIHVVTVACEIGDVACCATLRICDPPGVDPNDPLVAQQIGPGVLGTGVCIEVKVWADGRHEVDYDLERPCEEGSRGA